MKGIIDFPFKSGFFASFAELCTLFFLGSRHYSEVN